MGLVPRVLPEGLTLVKRPVLPGPGFRALRSWLPWKPCTWVAASPSQHLGRNRANVQSALPHGRSADEGLVYYGALFHQKLHAWRHCESTRLYLQCWLFTEFIVAFTVMSEMSSSTE